MDRHDRLLTTGNIAIKPLPVNSMRNVRAGQSFIFLLMGPTGAGKSNFIEALAGHGQKKLGISKDQLDGYTQGVTAYEIENAKWKTGSSALPIYIVDTPGFSDSQISELEIVDMVNNWMKLSKFPSVNVVLYLCPITDTRLAGSKKKKIELLKSLTGIDGRVPGAVGVITTMWDDLGNDQARDRAEVRFTQLRDDTWKVCPKSYKGRRENIGVELIQKHGLITRFLNTQESALQILNSTIGQHMYGAFLHAYRRSYDHHAFKEEPYTAHLYQNLLDRIQGAQLHLQTLENDLAQPDTQDDEELRSILEGRLHATHQLLSKFEAQRVAFGEPPSSLLEQVDEKPLEDFGLDDGIAFEEPQLPEPTATNIRSNSDENLGQAIGSEENSPADTSAYKQGGIKVFIRDAKAFGSKLISKRR